MIDKHLDFDPLELFSAYMKLCDVPRLGAEETNIKQFKGKKLGIVNGSAWVQLWSYYFGRKFLPGVKLVNIGNEGIQLNFMEAHHKGEACPPRSNIDLFADYVVQVKELTDVDAVIVTCSTMNRSFSAVQEALKPYSIPIIQIDEPMMEEAVKDEGRILVIATHGPTVASTTELLKETALKSKAGNIEFAGTTVEEAFDALGKGEIKRHNEIIAQAIITEQKKQTIDRVVLAQLSMSVFKFSYPEPEQTFGIPVITSGEEGFKRVACIFQEGV